MKRQVRPLPFLFEELLASYPSDRARTLEHLDKANRLRAECGCALGGKLLLSSTGLGLAYLAYRFYYHLDSLVKLTCFVMLAVVASSIVGKVIGIT